MRKSIVILVAICLMLFPCVGYSFTDVPVGNLLLTEATGLLSEHGIIKGDGDGTFRPDDGITRAEMAQIMCNLYPEEELLQELTEVSFPDLSGEHWAYNAICAMTQLGIIAGDEEGTVRPDDFVTNAEAVTIILRIKGLENEANESGGFPYGYINVAMETTILNGLSFELEKPATRGNVAIMVYNMMADSLR